MSDVVAAGVRYRGEVTPSGAARVPELVQGGVDGAGRAARVLA